MLKTEFETMTMTPGATISYDLYAVIQEDYMTSSEDKQTFTTRVFGKNNSQRDIAEKQYKNMRKEGLEIRRNFYRIMAK